MYATEFDSARVNTIDLSNNNAVTSVVPTGASGMRDVVMSPDGCSLAAAGQNSNAVYFMTVSPCEPLPLSLSGGSQGSQGGSSNVSTGGTALASTGFDSSGLGIIGATVVLLGLALVSARARRRI